MTRLTPLLRIAAVALLLCSGAGHTGTVRASPSHIGTQSIPRVFLPIVSQLKHSPIPVFLPTWLPSIPKSTYAGKIYPLFCTYRREHGIGPSYELGLFTARRFCVGADRLWAIFGIESPLMVDTHTRPVWLGKKGWAYLRDGGNVGTTISIVRTLNPNAFLPVYSYTLIYGCPNTQLPWPRYLACLKRVAASVERYVPGFGMR